jgi:hypothetical protein
MRPGYDGRRKWLSMMEQSTLAKPSGTHAQDKQLYEHHIGNGKTRTFLCSKVNILLLLVFIALLIVFGTITGLITIPDFRHKHSTGNGADFDSTFDRARWAVIPSNFPDPCLINDGDTWYAFATRTTPEIHIQMATAPYSDISNWTLRNGFDALPTLGAWAASHIQDPAVWAPYVVNMVSVFGKRTPISLRATADRSGGKRYICHVLRSSREE